MTECDNPNMVEFSKDLKTPIELPSIESWPNDKCKFMERGKVLTKISSNKICCLQTQPIIGWHLCYVIRTSDDILIIFITPKKGFVLNLSSAVYMKISRNKSSISKRMSKVKVKWIFGKVELKFTENQILIWRQRFLSTFGQTGDQIKTSMIINPKIQNDKFDKNEMDHEGERDTTDSVLSLTGKYNLPSHSSKSSENSEHIESILLHSELEKTASVF
uniref:PH-15 domain-containing protein n=1 Tax=Wuchereria bancrofti TaxID=6293 RepID=A0A1I8EYK0_WUCBA